jgi:hypothetical protein
VSSLYPLTCVVPNGDGFLSLSHPTRISSDSDGNDILTLGTRIDPDSNITTCTIRLDEGGSPDLDVTREILNVRRHIVLQANFITA